MKIPRLDLGLDKIDIFWAFCFLLRNCRDLQKKEKKKENEIDLRARNKMRK